MKNEIERFFKNFHFNDFKMITIYKDPYIPFSSTNILHKRFSQNKKIPS